MKRRTKKAIGILLAVVLCAGVAFGGVLWYSNRQMEKIPGLTFAQALAYATRDNPDAVITVGVIKDGQSSYTVYGENGKELSPELHLYEIGSLTKTFTAALVNKGITEGKIHLDDTIEAYLPLPKGNAYPTVKALLTHTSGYRGYYFERPMISNFFTGRNDFYGITREMALHRASRVSLDRETAGFAYSNYGYAVLGLVLEAVYDTDYTTLVNDFAGNELGLQETRISDQKGDLGNQWAWQADDAYLPAGALVSNIADMLSYAQMQLESNPYFSRCHQSLQRIDASSQAYAAMGIHMDEIGMAWILDTENGILWHNGATGHYNSYLGVCPEKGTAVVVLSNLAPNERIPATVLGIKLLME